MSARANTDDWYVGREGRQLGPYRWRVIQLLAAAGKLAPRDYLWSEGMAEWSRVSHFPELLAVPERAREVAERPGANYLLQHWRGRLSLPVSYWINGSLASILVLGLNLWIGSSDGFGDLGVVGTGASLLGMLTFAYVATVWQEVGVWRSAGRHVTRGGSRGWAIAARIVTVCAAVSFIAQALQQQPLWKQSALLLVGREDIPRGELVLSNDGAELEVSGGLTFGTAAAFESMIETAPSVRLVRLNSVGGWISEGLKLEASIERHGLITVTDDECVSACLLAFLGGKERWLSKGARLGFHQSSVAGVGGGVASEGNARFRSIFRSKGLPEAFIDAALAAAPTEMWYPTEAELLEANVVTRIVE